MLKVAAGVLYTIGFVFLAVTVSVVVTKNSSSENKDAALGGLILGLPATAAATMILVNSDKTEKAQTKQLVRQTEQIFLEMVTANNGRITAIKFAIATNLSLQEPKQYLDQKAIELNANFEVTDTGGVNYYFDV